MLFLRWFISACAIFLTSYIVPGVKIQNFWSAFWVAFVLAFVNTIIRPICLLLTLPLNFLTLGLFTLVINAFMVMLVSSMVDSFQIPNFWVALIFSLVLALLNAVFSMEKK